METDINFLHRSNFLDILKVFFGFRRNLCLQVSNAICVLMSDTFRRRLNNITRVPVIFTRVPVIFTTRKLKTAVPSLKSKIPNHLCSNVVYHITCPGCSASYVGQTTLNLITRLNEHSRISTPVGEHMTQCIGNTENLMAKIIDRFSDTVKLLTLEALHINRLKQRINRKEEYRSRELTVKV